MKKKIFSVGMMGVASVVSVAAPVALAISCGGGGSGTSNPYGNYSALELTNPLIANQDENERNVAEAAKDTTIKVGVRQSEKAVYDAIAKKFNSYNNGKVDIIPIDEANYETMGATGNLPTVFFIGSSSDAIQKNKWIKPIDIDSFTKENPDLYNVDNSGKEVNFDEAHINQGHLRLVSNDHGVNFALPTGYTSNGIMMNWEVVDTTKKIHSYAPGSNDSFIRSISETPFSLAQGANGVGECSYDGIQTYLSGAGIAPGATKDNSTPDGNWLGYGPGNVLQRIYSVGKSCQFTGLDMPITVVKERMIDPALWAATGVSIDGKDWYDTATNTISEDVFVKALNPSNVDDRLEKYLWNSIIGYFNPTGFVTAFKASGDPATSGEVEPVYRKQAMFNFNAKWAYKMIEGSWTNDEGHLKQKLHDDFHKDVTWAQSGHAASSGQLAVFSSPYDRAAGDSFAINRNADDAQTLVAKRFLKFINQIDDSYAMDYSEPVEGGDPLPVHKTPGMAITYKMTASVNMVQDKQFEAATTGFTPDQGIDPTHEEIARKSSGAWFNTGKAGNQESAIYNGVGGTVWAKFGPYWNLLDKPFMIDMQGIFNNTNTTGTTYQQYTDKFQSIARNFQSDYSIQ